MRRVTAAFVALVLLALLPGAVVRADDVRFFSDVSAGQWYAAAVRKLFDMGVVKGGGDLRFRPSDPVTRAEFVKMLVLSDGLIPVGVACTAAFRDVPCDHWAANYVELAHRMAIADGVQSDRFDPDGLVTREQLVTMFERALGRALQRAPADARAALGRFTDAGAVHVWALDSMALAVKEGVLLGTAGGALEPGRAATRAEAAALLERAVLPHFQRAKAATVDGHNLPYNRVLTVRATAYAGDEPGIGQYGATGMRVRPGMIAVDPSVIPLGTLLYVEGYGYGIAADTGSAIKGMRVDLFVASAGEADRFGVQTRAVYIIESASPTVAGG